MGSLAFYFVGFIACRVYIYTQHIHNIYTHIYTYIHTYTHIHTYIHIYTHISIYIYIYIHFYTHAPKCTEMYEKL